MLNTSAWFERYKERYRWAVRAYDRFVQDLAPDLVATLRHDQQVTVAVYGPTQVGKTTLILDLLGLSTLTTDEVGRVLRGGQQAGKSATATAIRYGRSQDDSWYISGEGPLTAEMACVKLSDFRRNVESGCIRDTDVLDIRIPRRLFPAPDDPKAGHGLNIIDIPGINSHLASEREYVSKLAERYVAVADLVLLVGRADCLGFLNEGDLIVPSLSDWAAQPTRFRIVLTRGFSLDSGIRKFHNQSLSVDEVREAYVRQMRTHDYHFPADFYGNLFVLELGNSVVELGRSEPDYLQRILPVTTAFRNELLESIAKAAGPYARLQGAFQLDRVVKAREERLSKAVEAQTDAFEEQRQQIFRELAAMRPDLLDADAEGVSEVISGLEGELLEIREKLHQLLGCMKKLEGFDFSSLFSFRLSTSPVEKVSWLKEQLASCEMVQRKACSETASCLVSAGIMPGWLQDYAPTIDYQRACLMEIDAHLDSYVVDSYWWSSSNFKEDRAKLSTALERNANDNGARLKKAVSRALAEKRRSLQADEKRLHSYSAILRLNLERLQRLEREHESICMGYESKLHEMRGALGMAERFSAQLDMAFIDELRRTQQDIDNHVIPAQRFYGLLHTRLLLSEIDRMYEGKSF